MTLGIEEIFILDTAANYTTYRNWMEFIRLSIILNECFQVHLLLEV